MFALRLLLFATIIAVITAQLTMGGGRKKRQYIGEGMKQRYKRQGFMGEGMHQKDMFVPPPYHGGAEFPQNSEYGGGNEGGYGGRFY
ncbi:hypothetical protein OESDEN_21366 [Oesophagostomum dentatum]|uniref:Uncharacterized protein n=1 Tax=Oesophagostomum dentatum TaxID=61180 RepID=A0A0B1S0X2_OESDE|nr:hypothetical protein OESDEN_21366 [Oesophagostomum dentatum]